MTGKGEDEGTGRKGTEISRKKSERKRSNMNYEGKDQSQKKNLEEKMEARNEEQEVKWREMEKR